MSRVVFMLHTEEDGSTDPTASVQSSDNPVSLSYSIFFNDEAEIFFYSKDIYGLMSQKIS